MPDTDAKRLDEIFNAARRLEDPAARMTYLEESCADQPALRQQIEALLAAYEGANTFLESPAIGLANITELRVAPTTARPSMSLGEQPGAVIHRYKLLERIGEGGFGVVYMAEQQHPVRRKVALKVLKPGMDTRQVIARFDAERQALAIMDHENIAKVFDGGMTDTGHPYFVMELVKGEPITEYCDRNLLPPRQRLELFVQVCHAVQHAHQKGVIHRDLKPGNVLVTVLDTRPVVKVIDFGIAKALGHELTEQTLFTGFAQLLGTPLYMSPEQAGQNALDIDTRSDIYALGVLLYELLTGTTPFDSSRFKKAAYEEIRRIIREEEPPRPSTRLSESKEKLPSVSALRHTELAKLTKLVRGELDWIVMRCLEKDRNRRYETANGLAMDLQRYLANEPVQACPPSARYRLRKFVSRYRVPLAVASGFLLLLLAGMVVSTWQAFRIRAEQQNTLVQKAEADKQRSRAEAERAAAVAAEQKALTEARKSEQVAKFMTEMLKSVGPSVARGRDTTMLREILDTTAKRLDQLKGQPAVEADLRMVLGSVYLDLSRYSESEAMFRSALHLRRELLGNKHSEVARALVELGESLRKQRKYAEAEPLVTEGLAIQRELLGDDNQAVALTVFRLGMLYNSQYRAAEAQARFREALTLYARHRHLERTGPLSLLALSLSSEGKHAEAEVFLRECVQLLRARTPAEGSSYLATGLHNLGFVLREQRKYAEAELCLREALDLRLKFLGEAHLDVEVTRCILGDMYVVQGRIDKAEPLAKQTIETARRRSPSGRVEATTPLLMMGAVHQASLEFEQAEKYFREAVAFVESDPTQPRWAKPLAVRRLAMLYDVWGKPEEAARTREKLNNPPPATRPASQPATRPAPAD